MSELRDRNGLTEEEYLQSINDIINMFWISSQAENSKRQEYEAGLQVLR